MGSQVLERLSVSLDTIALKEAIAHAVTAAVIKTSGGVTPLSNLVFDFGVEGLWISGFDSDLKISRLVADVEGDYKGVVYIPAKQVADIAARLNSKERTEFVAYESEIELKQGDRSYRIPAKFDCEDYPQLNDAEDGLSFYLEDRMRDALDSLTSICPDEGSKKYSGLQPILFWVRLMVKDNEMVGMAGFSHRYGYVTQASNAPDLDILLSKRFIRAIAKQSGVFKVRLTESLITVESTSTRVSGRLGVGNFPPLHTLVQAYKPVWEFAIATKPLTSALSDIKVVINEKKPGVLFEPLKSGDGFLISPKNKEAGDGQIEVRAEVQPGQIPFALSYFYLRDGLSFLGAEDVFVDGTADSMIVRLKTAIADGVEKNFFVAGYSSIQDAKEEEKEDRDD